MSLISLQLNRFGHIHLSFVNARLLRRVLAVVVRSGGSRHTGAYLQNESDVQALLAQLPTNARREVEAGWEVRVRMDPWEAAHYFGFDAHTAFERTGS